MNKQELTKKVKEKARDLGFDLVGITSPDPPPHFDVYKNWLSADFHGEMKYLANDRAIEWRADPHRLLPDCKSILVLGIPYSKPSKKTRLTKEPGPQGRIASYAWGDDYHETLQPRLQQLVSFMEEQVGASFPNRWYTDTGPILERDFAQRAGQGWIGKNSMLINPKRGSYYLLAEILLAIQLEHDQPFASDHCGTCTRCIEACPTDCILPDRTLDANRCISYLSIELKGTIPHEMRSQMEDWVFGCDICQQVCPWNIRFAPEMGDKDFAPRQGHTLVDLEKEIRLNTYGFNHKFKNNPVKRPKRRGYLRNVAIALGNARQPRSVPVLFQVFGEEPEALVRGAIAWALAEIGGQEARTALNKALRTENDASVLNEIELALEKLA